MKHVLNLNMIEKYGSTGDNREVKINNTYRLKSGIDLFCISNI